VNRERERERERESETRREYWAKCSQTIKNRRQLAICDSDKYASRFIANGRRQHGSGAYISALYKEQIMQNIALVCDRGCKLKRIDNIFIADCIIDLHLVGSGSYAFPLYVKSKE